MAVTSLWAVRGNLGVVLDYAANPEKTDLMNLLRYATQQRKTTVQEEGTPVKQLVTGIHCAPATACQEMQAVACTAAGMSVGSASAMPVTSVDTN